MNFTETENLVDFGVDNFVVRRALAAQAANRMLLPIDRRKSSYVLGFRPQRHTRPLFKKACNNIDSFLLHLIYSEISKIHMF